MRSTRLIGVTLAAFLATSLGGAASAADMAGGCSIEVAQMEDEYRREYITGMSVLADVSSSRRPDSFAELSCLERLMNSVMDVFFEPPGLPDLLGELENFICDQATEVFREVSGEMAHRFDANLPVGEIIPGGNLVSMRGSLRSQIGRASDGERVG